MPRLEQPARTRTRIRDRFPHWFGQETAALRLEALIEPFAADIAGLSNEIFALVHALSIDRAEQVIAGTDELGAFRLPLGSPHGLHRIAQLVGYAPGPRQLRWSAPGTPGAVVLTDTGTEPLSPTLLRAAIRQHVRALVGDHTESVTTAVGLLRFTAARLGAVAEDIHGVDAEGHDGWWLPPGERFVSRATLVWFDEGGRRSHALRLVEFPARLRTFAAAPGRSLLTVHNDGVADACAEIEIEATHHVFRPTIINEATHTALRLDHGILDPGTRVRFRSNGRHVVTEWTPARFPAPEPVLLLPGSAGAWVPASSVDDPSRALLPLAVPTGAAGFRVQQSTETVFGVARFGRTVFPSRGTAVVEDGVLGASRFTDEHVTARYTREKTLDARPSHDRWIGGRSRLRVRFPEHQPHRIRIEIPLALLRPQDATFGRGRFGQTEFETTRADLLGAALGEDASKIGTDPGGLRRNVALGVEVEIAYR